VAPAVKAVCIKDHLGLRGDENFPIPGQGNVDHEALFRTLFAAGFDGPLAIERLDGKDGFRSNAPPDVVDRRISAAYQFLAPLLDRITAAA
jgi:sugar phosphate isomerase/epimerase